MFAMSCVTIFVFVSIFHIGGADFFESETYDESKDGRELLKHLADDNARYHSELRRLNTKMAEMENMLSANLDKLCLNHATFKNKRLLMADQSPMGTSNHVAFNTQLTKTLQHLTTNQIVIFNNILLNNGNSYSSLDGEFVCTLKGTYFMTWTITCSDNTAIETELVVNGQIKSHVFTDAGNHADYETNSGNAVLDLNVGDRVWIRVGNAYHGQIVGSNLGSSTFSGFLVSPSN